MNWFSSSKNPLDQVISDQKAIIQRVRPDLAGVIDTRSPDTLLNSLLLLLAEESRHNQAQIQNLVTRLEEANDRAFRFEKVMESWRADLAWKKVKDLEEELGLVRSELQSTLVSIHGLKVVVENLEKERDALRSSVADLNRLTARQHQQLIDLLGTDFERP